MLILFKFRRYHFQEVKQMRSKSFFLVVCLLFLSATVDLCAKVRFLTFHYNKPEFIKLQYETLAKFVQNDYELIVINDAKSPALENEIELMCKQYGIPCIRYEQSWHQQEPLNFLILDWLNNPDIYSYHFFNENTIECIANQPSVRHSHVICYALEKFGYDHDDIVVLLDGDVFPIRPIDVRELLKDRDIVAVRKRLPESSADPLTIDKIDYLWVTFAAFNPSKIPNARELQFQVDLINNKIHDTGAASYHYLAQYPYLKFTLFPRYSSHSLAQLGLNELIRMGFRQNEIDFIKKLPSRHFVEFYVGHRLLHFSNSCWDHPGYQEKTAYVQEFINKLLLTES